MKKLLLIFFLAFTFLCSNAQIIIKGKIIDSVSNQPIGFASIGIEGNNKGTVTNEKGVFVINVDTLPISLKIFYIGYVSKIVVVNSNEPFIIKMRQLTFNLKDVVVKANEGDIIFKKAYKKLLEQKPFVYKSKSFFRLITKNDDTYTEMIENFYDTWLSKSGIKHWELEHGRYALIKNYDLKGYAVSVDLSILTRYIDILNMFQTEDINYVLFVFDSKYFDHLVFNISSRFVSDEDEIVKIDFNPVKKDRDKIFCSGSVYVNTKTFDVYRLVQQWDKLQKPLLRTENKKREFKNFKVGFDISFKPNKEHVMLINNIHIKINYDLVEIETEKLVHNVSTYSNLLFYDYDSKPSNIDSITKDYYNFDYSDYTEINHRLYMKRFWDNNPVLAETPIEKGIREDFEKSGSFGKAFNDANDTLELLKDGYKIWSKKEPLNLEDITNKNPNNLRSDKLEIKKEGETIGELYSQIYFAWNCYNDSFYYVLLPILDTKSTWLSDDYRTSPQMDFIYKKYFDLVEIYKQKFDLTLKENNPCFNKKNMMKIYENINKNFKSESFEMVKECWSAPTESERMKMAYKWQKKIDEILGKHKENTK